MLHKIRSNELTIFGATWIFFSAWSIADLRISENVQPTTLLNAFDDKTSGTLLNITSYFSCILLLLILLGGLPILLAAGRTALKMRNYRALGLCLLGLMSPFIIDYGAFMATLDSGHITIWLGMIVHFIGIGLGLALIVFAVQRVAPSRRITNYAFYLATLLPVLMLVGLILLEFLVIPSVSLALTLANPASYIAREITMTLIMIMSLGFSFISLKQGWQARQAAQIAQ